MTMKSKICLLAILMTFFISYKAVSAKTVPPSTNTEVPEKLVLLQKLRNTEKSKQEEIHQEHEKQLGKTNATVLNEKIHQKTLEEISMKDTTTLPVPNTLVNSESDRSKRHKPNYMRPCYFKICNYG